MTIRSAQATAAGIPSRFLHQSLSERFAVSSSGKKPRPAGGLLVLLLCIAASVLLVASPGFAQISIELDEGVELHLQGKYQEAIKAYSDALRKDPKSAEAYNWRGMAYDDLGDSDKALQDLNEAIKLNGNYADAYNNRGEVYRKQKMYPQALQDYGQALRLDPNFAEAYYNQGLIHREQNKAPQAVAAFQSYIRLKPDANDKQEVEDIIKTLKGGAAPAAATKPGAPPTPAATTKAPAQAPAKPGDPAQIAKTAPPAAKPGVAPPAGKPGAAPPAKKGPAPAAAPDDMSALMGALMTGDADKISGVVMKILGAVLIFLAIGVVVYWILTSLPYMLLASKTGTGSGWMAFVPVLDEYLKAKMAGKGMLMFILLALGDPVVLLLVSVPLSLLLSLVMPFLIFLVPIVVLVMYLASTVAWVPVCMGIAQARGKATFWGLLICAPIIVVCLLSSAVGFLMPDLAKEPIVNLALLAVGLLPFIGVPYYLALSK